MRIVETTAQLDAGQLVADTPTYRAGRPTVAFPPELLPELRWHLERLAEPGERGLVFGGPKGARLRRSNFRRIWTTARSKAGVPDLHVHALRHVGGTLAAATGASPNELMTRLGHSSTRAALLYQHATRDRDQAIAKALGSLVREVRNPGSDGIARRRSAVRGRRSVARRWPIPGLGLRPRPGGESMSRGLTCGGMVGAPDGNTFEPRVARPG
jgi:hypothetical protein